MTDAAPRVLVAGIGNIFLGDDAFGIEVVSRLSAEELPPVVDVADFGIRGVHLAYELLSGAYPTLILVDAVPLNEPPGTLEVLEVTADVDEESFTAADVLGGAAVDAHAMSPHIVLRVLKGLGGAMPRTVIVACQPAVLDEGVGLSPAVLAAVDGALALVHEVAATEAARLSPTVVARAG
jgi:hydrogenase maturation protease